MKTKAERLQDRLDELAEWHATFPGRKPDEVCALLEKCERRGRRQGLLEAADIIRERYRVTSGLGYLSPALRKCFQAIEAEAQKLK